MTFISHLSLNTLTNLCIVLYQLKVDSTPLCIQEVQDSNPGQETVYLKVFRGIPQSFLGNEGAVYQIKLLPLLAICFPIRYYLPSATVRRYIYIYMYIYIYI
jgi:hypothetical protein